MLFYFYWVCHLERALESWGQFLWQTLSHQISAFITWACFFFVFFFYQKNQFVQYGAINQLFCMLISRFDNHFLNLYVRIICEQISYRLKNFPERSPGLVRKKPWLYYSMISVVIPGEGCVKCGPKKKDHLNSIFNEGISSVQIEF